MRERLLLVVGPLDQVLIVLVRLAAVEVRRDPGDK